MKKNKIERRDFLRAAGALGLGSLSGVIQAGQSKRAEKQNQYPQIPKRKLGKSDIEIPVLALGAAYNMVENQNMLEQSLKWGVNYWDTSSVSGGGNSELGIGKFLERNPKRRKDVFIVTKAAHAKSVEDVERLLQQSLKRLNTDYIDFFVGAYIVNSPRALTEDLKKWSLKAKQRGLIRLFGFTTHSSMVPCLEAASSMAWIDAIMFAYNFRQMQNPKLQKAIDACHRAGIGLVAMKTQGMGQSIESEKDKELTDHFIQKGYTAGQAKTKAVLQDKRISAACVRMENTAVLTANASAVLDKTKLTQNDMDVLKAYAFATCSGYCAGCADICGKATGNPYVSDIMRYLMYYNSYGDPVQAKNLFAQLPLDIRNRLMVTDYAVAEARCPQKMPIAHLMTEARRKLA